MAATRPPDTMGPIETLLLGAGSVLLVVAVRWAIRTIHGVAVPAVRVETLGFVGPPKRPRQYLRVSLEVRRGEATPERVQMQRVAEPEAIVHTVPEAEVISFPQPPRPPFRLGEPLPKGAERTFQIDLTSTRAWLRDGGTDRPAELRVVLAGPGGPSRASPTVVVDPTD